MFEDSPEGFVGRWKRQAVEVEVFPRAEGNPLFECAVAGTLIQLFERTGPFLARPGKRKVIVHPVAESLEPCEALSQPVREIVPLGLSSIAVTGQVVACEGNIAIIDAGAPLVVGVVQMPAAGFAQGSWVSFTAEAPVHGFVVAEAAAFQLRRAHDRHDDQI